MKERGIHGDEKGFEFYTQIRGTFTSVISVEEHLKPIIVVLKCGLTYPLAKSRKVILDEFWGKQNIYFNSMGP